MSDETIPLKVSATCRSEALERLVKELFTGSGHFYVARPRIQLHEGELLFSPSMNIGVTDREYFAVEIIIDVKEIVEKLEKQLPLEPDPLPTPPPPLLPPVVAVEPEKAVEPDVTPSITPDPVV